jgi:hypothetical protein
MCWPEPPRVQWRLGSPWLSFASHRPSAENPSVYLTMTGINVTAVARSRTGHDPPSPGDRRVAKPEAPAGLQPLGG